MYILKYLFSINQNTFTHWSFMVFYVHFRFAEKPFLYYYYWRTSVLFPADEVAGPRDPDDEYGALPRKSFI